MYDRNRQSGDLTKAVDKAKNNNSKKTSKTKIALTGVALIALGGIALGIAGKDQELPPHEERITYIAKNLPEEEGMHIFHYPYFQMAFMATDGERLGYGLERLGFKRLAGAAFIDNDLTDEGTIDEIGLMIKDEEGFKTCYLGEGEFTGMEDVINRDYQFATNAFYRALTGKNKLMKGIFGKKEFNLLAEKCEGRWEPREDTFDISMLSRTKKDERIL